MVGTQFESVLAAAQTGAEWALSALYRDLHPALLRYLSAQEPDEGEDVEAEVWVQVAQSLARFEGGESAFRCWLFTIARRRLVDLRRQRARRRTDTVPPQLLTERPDPSEAFAAVESEGALGCLAALPCHQAEIVLLRVVAGLDSYEVAAITGRKPGTVRVLQKRALEKLATVVPRDSRSAVTRDAPRAISDQR